MYINIIIYIKFILILFVIPSKQSFIDENVALQNREETNYNSQQSDESQEKDVSGGNEGDTITKTFHMQLEPYMYLTKKISKSNYNRAPYSSKSDQYFDERSKNNQGHLLKFLRSNSVETDFPDNGKFADFSEFKALPKEVENFEKYDTVPAQYFQLDEKNDQPNKFNNLYSHGLNANDIGIENGRSVINSLKEYLNKPNILVKETPDKSGLPYQSKNYGSVKKIKSVFPFQNGNHLQTDIYFPTGSHASFRNKLHQFTNELPKNTKVYNKPVHGALITETNQFNNIYPDALNVNDNEVENSNIVINSLKEDLNKPILPANETPYKNELPNKLKRYENVKKIKSVYPNKNTLNFQSDLDFPKDAYTFFENKQQLNELPTNTKTYNDYNNAVYDYNNSVLNSQKLNKLSNFYPDELNVSDKKVGNSNSIINSLKESLNKPIVLENEAPNKYRALDKLNNYGTVKIMKPVFPNENALNLQSNLYFPKDTYTPLENEHRLFELPKNTKTHNDYSTGIHGALNEESKEVNKLNNVHPDKLNVNDKVENVIHSLKEYLNKPTVLLNEETDGKYPQPDVLNKAKPTFPTKNAFNFQSGTYFPKDSYASFENRQPFTNEFGNNMNTYNDYNNVAHGAINKERKGINKQNSVYHDELNVNDKEVENGKFAPYTIKKYLNEPASLVNEEPDDYRQLEKPNDFGTVEYIKNAFPNENEYDLQSNIIFLKDANAESLQNKQQQLANALPKNTNMYNDYYKTKQGDVNKESNEINKLTEIHAESSQQENKQSNNFKLENFISKYFQPDNFESKYYKSENGTLPVEVLDSLKSNGPLKKIDINVKITAYFEPSANDQGQLDLLPGDSK